MNQYKLLFFSALIAFFVFLVGSGCRKDIGILPPITDQVFTPGSYGVGSDFYLLNEGSMGSNNASLDFFNHLEGTYALNMYGSVNPGTPLGLGDLGNDIKVYGGKLYVVINGSAKVEVLDKATAVKLCQISIENPRRVAFWKDKVFITSYKGVVAVMDTSKLRYQAGNLIPDLQIKVGREPEGLAVAGDQLFVANSGGYSPPGYDNTVSVIDLPSMSVVKILRLDVNLNDIQKDAYGHLIVSARGDYGKITPSFFILDDQTGKVLQRIHTPISNFSVNDSIMYYFTVSYDYQTGHPTVTYNRYNLKTLTEISGSFLSEDAAAKIKTPFAIMVDPRTDGTRIIITDVGDYTTPGFLYWIDMQGNILQRVQTGVVPGHIAFLE